MARRSDHSKEEIKALAIKHAYKLIEENGEAGFKARDIAKRMGYTVGTIYYVFGNMENLRFHVCGHIMDLFNVSALKGLARKKNKLLYLVTHYIKISKEYRNQWMFLFNFQGTFRDNVPDWYIEKTRRGFKMFAEHLAPHIGNKQKTLKATEIILASIHGMCILSLNDKSTKSKKLKTEAMAKHLVETYLKGLNN